MRHSVLLGVALLALSACGAKQPPVYQAIGTPMQINVEGPTLEWAPGTSTALMPTGVWVRAGDTTAYSYVDGELGLSARWMVGDTLEIRRLSVAPEGLVVLSAEQAAEEGFDAQPEWLVNYGPQPESGTLYGSWRAIPAFARRSHPDYPDDIRAVIGGPGADGRFTFEVIWMRVLGCEQLRCVGSLMNEPNNIVDIHNGDRLWVDLTGAQSGRLPAATPDGQQSNPQLVGLAATDPRLSGLIQDDALWTAAPDTDIADRLPPVSQWGFVGESIAYFFLGYEGVEAAIVRTDGVGFQAVQWMPAGFVPLTDAQIAEFNLPATLEFEGAPPQPEPGRWGQWRADDATSWLFYVGGQPDTATVKTSAQSEELSKVMVTGCDELVCWGWLGTSADGMQAGDLVEFTHLRPPDQSGSVFPVVQPSTR